MDLPRIARSEHRARQAALRAEAERRGWPGIVVIARGGNTYDRHGDLMYLTGHYQAFVNVPDRPPLWSGRAHAALVLPVDGEPILLCSAPDVDSGVAVDDVRVTSMLAHHAGVLMRELGGGGFSGFDTVPHTIARELPLDLFEPAEAAVEALRRRKSTAEQGLLRYACQLASEAVDALMAAAAPDAAAAEAVARAAAVVVGGGAMLYSASLSSGARIASFTGKPFPGFDPRHRFQTADPVRLDLSLVYEGYYADLARSWVVGGSGLNPAADRLIAAVRTALDAAVSGARSGATAGELARLGAAAMPDWASAEYPVHWGHGLGMGWEGPWLLTDSDEVIESGFTLAIERSARVDGLVMAGEHDVLVTDDAPVVLTSAGWHGA
jgi:Xaa-Pro dipeptidase